jgi:hypothetical protein
MNLIDNFLKQERLLDLDDNSETPDEEKLECFYTLFVNLQKKYNCNIDDMKQLELEHKDELSQVRNVLDSSNNQF